MSVPYPTGDDSIYCCITPSASQISSHSTLGNWDGSTPPSRNPVLPAAPAYIPVQHVSLPRHDFLLAASHPGGAQADRTHMAVLYGDFDGVSAHVAGGPYSDVLDYGSGAEVHNHYITPSVSSHLTLGNWDGSMPPSHNSPPAALDFVAAMKHVLPLGDGNFRPSPPLTSNSRGTQVHGPALRSSSVLRTLDPAKLTPKDHITSAKSPSCLKSFEICVQRVDDGYPSVSILHNPPRGDSGGNLAGFLYYYQPPHAPPLAGELRFRITASVDPASFPSGVDHTIQQGVPWSIPLRTIAGKPNFTPIRYLLTDVDATVPHLVMDLAREYQCIGGGQASRCLYAFGQPFHLPLTSHAPAFVFFGKDRVARPSLKTVTGFYTGNRVSSGPHYPFSGSIICCFEPSSLEEHSGRRVAVIRVLRTLAHDPVRPNPRYTGPPIPPGLCPREGELLTRLYRRKVKVWAADVDAAPTSRNAQAAALSILFDNALEYGSPCGFAA